MVEEEVNYKGLHHYTATGYGFIFCYSHVMCIDDDEYMRHSYLGKISNIEGLKLHTNEGAEEVFLTSINPEDREILEKFKKEYKVKQEIRLVEFEVLENPKTHWLDYRVYNENLRAYLKNLKKKKKI